jgi:CheY-like chemotaxis protein
MSVNKLKAAPNKDEPLRRHNFLVVDDNPVNRKLLTIVLENRGHSVDQASGGLAAIKAVKTQRYDTIFIDIRMPDMDGITAISEIRKQEHCAHVPIIAVTADCDYGDREKYMGQGADGYMTKPFQIDKLHEEWENLVYSEEETRPAERVSKAG